MSNRVFFTADTHFGHERVGVRHRGFGSIEEHDQTLIDNWNAVVTKGDRVYHLGDFALGSQENAKVCADKLLGHVYLIRGNHEGLAEHRTVRDRFIWIKDVFNLHVGGQQIWLSHYCHRTWKNSHHGAWHLYGHSHGSLRQNYSTRALDVGVDCWSYAPVLYDQVAEEMAKHSFVPVDRHGELEYRRSNVYRMKAGLRTEIYDTAGNIVEEIK